VKRPGGSVDVFQSILSARFGLAVEGRRGDRRIRWAGRPPPRLAGWAVSIGACPDSARYNPA